MDDDDASRNYAPPTTATYPRTFAADSSSGDFANIPAGPFNSILHPLATLQNPTHQKAELALYSLWALLFLLLMVSHCLTTPSIRTRALGRNFGLAYPLALLAAAITSMLYLADSVLTFLSISRPRAYIILYTVRYFTTLSTLTLLLGCIATAISQLHRRQTVRVVVRFSVAVLAGLVLATTGLLLQAAIAWIEHAADAYRHGRTIALLAIVSEFWAFGAVVMFSVLAFVRGREESHHLGLWVKHLVVPAALALTIYRIVLTAYYTIPALDGAGRTPPRTWPLIHAIVSPLLFLLLAIALLLLGRVERNFLHGGAGGKGRPDTLRSDGDGSWLPPIDRTEELRYSWASTQPARTVLSTSGDSRTVESETGTTVVSGPPPVMRRGPARRVDQVGP